MKVKVSILLILALAQIHFSLSTPKFQYTGNLLEVTDNNFQNAVDNFDFLFLKLYAPWCPHCQDLAPKFKKLAGEYRNSKSKT